MDSVLITILNMSLTGAFVIAAVAITRLALKKAPKMISYCLWAVAGFRLVVPFSFESALSLMPFGAQPITQGIPEYTALQVYTVLNNTPDAAYPWLAGQAAGPQQILLSLGFYTWLLGVLVMFICGIVSFLNLKRRMRGAHCIISNIFEADNLETPFVLGIFTPVIYIPAGLAAHERKYIILHEQTHIRRSDHIIKLLAYFILCLHWFNPLAWVAFLLMGVDMEMSCDERVLKEMGAEMKTDYSRSLIKLATQRRFLSGSPLAFGEGGVKGRVRNILNFGKTSRLVTILAVALALVFSIGFSVDKAPAEDVVNLTIGFGAAYETAEGDNGQGDAVFAVLLEIGPEARQNAQQEQQKPQKPQKQKQQQQQQQTVEPKQPLQQQASGLIQQSGHNVEYMAIRVEEAGTDSLGRLLSNDKLPYGRYYYSMSHRGDVLYIAYAVCEQTSES